MSQDIAVGTKWVPHKDHPKNRGKVFTVTSVSPRYIGYQSNTAKAATYCSPEYFMSRYKPEGEI